MKLNEIKHGAVRIGHRAYMVSSIDNSAKSVGIVVEKCRAGVIYAESNYGNYSQLNRDCNNPQVYFDNNRFVSLNCCMYAFFSVENTNIFLYT